MPNVKVYSTPMCPWCKKTKEFLTQNNIEFQDFDVSSDEKARNELLDKTGQMGVPVTDVDGSIIIGFDVERLKKAFNL